MVNTRKNLIEVISLVIDGMCQSCPVVGWGTELKGYVKMSKTDIGLIPTFEAAMKLVRRREGELALEMITSCAKALVTKNGYIDEGESEKRVQARKDRFFALAPKNEDGSMLGSYPACFEECELEKLLYGLETVVLRAHSDHLRDLTSDTIILLNIFTFVLYSTRRLELAYVACSISLRYDSRQWNEFLRLAMIRRGKGGRDLIESKEEFLGIVLKAREAFPTDLFIQQVYLTVLMDERRYRDVLAFYYEVVGRERAEKRDKFATLDAAQYIRKFYGRKLKLGFSANDRDCVYFRDPLLPWYLNARKLLGNDRHSIALSPNSGPTSSEDWAGLAAFHMNRVLSSSSIMERLESLRPGGVVEPLDHVSKSEIMYLRRTYDRKEEQGEDGILVKEENDMYAEEEEEVEDDEGDDYGDSNWNSEDEKLMIDFCMRNRDWPPSSVPQMMSFESAHSDARIISEVTLFAVESARFILPGKKLFVEIARTKDMLQHMTKLTKEEEWMFDECKKGGGALEHVDTKITVPRMASAHLTAKARHRCALAAASRKLAHFDTIREPVAPHP